MLQFKDKNRNQYIIGYSSAYQGIVISLISPHNNNNKYYYYYSDSMKEPEVSQWKEVNKKIIEQTGIDLTGDGIMDINDMIHLMFHINFPDDDNYFIDENLNLDLNNDGVVNADDATYLLNHVIFPDDYPIDQSNVSNLSSDTIPCNYESFKFLHIKIIENDEELRYLCISNPTPQFQYQLIKNN